MELWDGLIEFLLYQIIIRVKWGRLIYYSFYWISRFIAAYAYLRLQGEDCVFTTLSLKLFYTFSAGGLEHELILFCCWPLSTIFFIGLIYFSHGNSCKLSSYFYVCISLLFHWQCLAYQQLIYSKRFQDGDSAISLDRRGFFDLLAFFHK